jgi:hypothetical protein
MANLDSAIWREDREQAGVCFLYESTGQWAQCALPYHSLRRVELYARADGMVVKLAFHEATVTLRGRNLDTLPTDFILRRVVNVRPVGRSEAGLSVAGEAVVESVRVDPRDDVASQPAPISRGYVS